MNLYPLSLANKFHIVGGYFLNGSGLKGQKDDFHIRKVDSDATTKQRLLRLFKDIFNKNTPPTHSLKT